MAKYRCGLQACPHPFICLFLCFVPDTRGFYTLLECLLASLNWLLMNQLTNSLTVPLSWMQFPLLSPFHVWGKVACCLQRAKSLSPQHQTTVTTSDDKRQVGMLSHHSSYVHFCTLVSAYTYLPLAFCGFWQKAEPLNPDGFIQESISHHGWIPGQCMDFFFYALHELLHFPFVRYLGVRTSKEMHIFLTKPVALSLAAESNFGTVLWCVRNSARRQVCHRSCFWRHPRMWAMYLSSQGTF